MSSPPNLPAQDRMSLFLVIFLQKSHFLDLSSCFFLQTPSFFPALPSCPREVPGSAFFHKKIPFFSVQMEPCFVQVGALILSTERFTTPLALSPPKRCCLKLLSVQGKFTLFCCYCWTLLINQQRENPNNPLLACPNHLQCSMSTVTWGDFPKNYPAPPGFGFL